MGYRVEKVALDAAFDLTTLVQPGTRLRGILVTDMPTGASLYMAIGSNALFRVNPGIGFQIDKDEDDATAAYGITIRNPIAQPGVTVEIMIVAGGA